MCALEQNTRPYSTKKSNLTIHMETSIIFCVVPKKIAISAEFGGAGWGE